MPSWHRKAVREHQYIALKYLLSRYDLDRPN